MTGKWHGSSTKGHGQRYGGALSSFGVPAGAIRAAGELIAREAQKKIDERKAKQPKERKVNSKYSKEFIAEVLRRHEAGEKLSAICRELGVKYPTALQWKYGVNRGKE